MQELSFSRRGELSIALLFLIFKTGVRTMTNEANNTRRAFFEGCDASARLGSCITGVFTGAQTYYSLMINRHQRTVLSSLHHPVPPILAAMGASVIAGGLSFFATNRIINSAKYDVQNTRIMPYDEQNVDNTLTQQSNKL
jgi:hypothetical protein